MANEELSEEERSRHNENTFKDEDGKLPESIGSAELNKWVLTLIRSVKFSMCFVKWIGRSNMEVKSEKLLFLQRTIVMPKRFLEVFGQESPQLSGIAQR